MSNVTANPNLDQFSGDQLARYAGIFCRNLISVINGSLDFESNFNCKLVSVNFNTINQDIPIAHGLGRVPMGRIVYSQACNGVILDGLTSNTVNTLYLRCGAIGKASLIVF